LFKLSLSSTTHILSKTSVLDLINICSFYHWNRLQKYPFLARTLCLLLLTISQYIEAKTLKKEWHWNRGVKVY
jgi:hypothetical protein